MINQVYGYLSLNNLIYGCVTCYDVTYFLWRPKRETLLISDPIFNNSESPTLLQALYYFVHLALEGHKEGIQKLDPSPKDSDFPPGKRFSKEKKNPDDHSNKKESDSNYPNTRQSKRFKNKTNNSTETNYVPNKNEKTEHNRNQSNTISYNADFKITKEFEINLDSYCYRTHIGSGATGDVFRLIDSNDVVKTCDPYNNPDGFKMLKKEISIYEKLSELNLPYVPRYNGVCDHSGQYFIGLEYIPGKHCDWRESSILKEKLDFIIQDLKSHGIVHQDLRPENVLLTPDGDIKLIDFGLADIQ